MLKRLDLEIVILDDETKVFVLMNFEMREWSSFL